MSYLIWVPIVCICFSIYAFLSHKSNTSGINWTIALFAFGAINQLWAIVSRYSKNLILDSFIYDICIIGSYTITLFLIRGDHIGVRHIIGAFLCVCGIICIK